MAAAAALSLLAIAASCFSSPASAALPTVSFDEAFSPIFGGDNLLVSPARRAVRLLLDRHSGSGFMSSRYYHYGFFSAYIKLPRSYTAGVVVAFYLSNGDVREADHDELDFEFLGNRRGQQWRVQTNVYGNGSTARGREERYLLPFDPTAAPHRYSILWAPTHTLFYVDGVPIREVVRSPAMGGDYPSKPMALYATIWDGSAWATDGGKYPANYKYAPFAADFSQFTLLAYRPSPGATAAAGMALRRRAAMRRFRDAHMTYTVCYDSVRYADGPFPECDNSDEESQRFWRWGESKVVQLPNSRRRRSGRRQRSDGPRSNSVSTV